MTDEEPRKEGADEAIEDLEAPADELEDVAGGLARRRELDQGAASIANPNEGSDAARR